MVGPLVLPGATPCLTCLDLHRVDRDRGWPVVAAQLGGASRPLGGQRTTAPCDVVLASAGGRARRAGCAGPPSTTPPRAVPGRAPGGAAPAGLWPRRRSWPLHPRAAAAGRPAAGVAGPTDPSRDASGKRQWGGDRPPAQGRDAHGQARGAAAGLRRAHRAGVRQARGRPARRGSSPPRSRPGPPSSCSACSASSRAGP